MGRARASSLSSHQRMLPSLPSLPSLSYLGLRNRPRGASSSFRSRASSSSCSSFSSFSSTSSCSSNSSTEEFWNQYKRQPTHGLLGRILGRNKNGEFNREMYLSARVKL